MRILFIVTHPEFGGTETHVLSLARALHQQSIQVGVATAGGPFVLYFQQAGISIHRIRELGRQSSINSAKRIAFIVRKYKYDIVHAHDTESFGVLTHLNRYSPQTPLVMTIHGKYITKNRIQSTARYVKRVIVVSPAVRRWVTQLGVVPHKVTSIPNGINTYEFTPASDSAVYRRMLGLPVKGCLGLYVGRFQGDKWRIARTCILASEKVARRNLAFHMVLVGFGGYRKTLLREAKKVNREFGRDVVQLRGPTRSIMNFYRSATFVIGTGRVALEAMACGKPVLSAGLVGYEGLVTSAKLPRLVAHHFGDHAGPTPVTVSNLAAGIEQILEKPALASTHGRAGRRLVVERFSIVQMARKTRNVYSQVLARR